MQSTRQNSAFNKGPSAFRRGMIVVAALTLLGCQRPQSERVLDDAGVLSPEEHAQIGEHHTRLLADHDIDYRVVTVNTQTEVDLYAAESFELLGVGRESAASRGLMLLVDPAKDQARLEVAYSLEGVFPDAFVAYVQRRHMDPFFQTDRVGAGIVAATELIAQRAADAEANLGFDVSVLDAPGATVDVQTRQTLEPKVLREYEAGTTPQETLSSYFDAMDARDTRPALPIYTVETQGVLADFRITPAQMEGILGAYRSCTAENTFFDGALAVIRYPATEATCSPWFFRQADDGWRLDLATMSQVIGFGRNNAWHFAPDAQHPYFFAFQDWSFDPAGFPHDEPVADHRVAGPSDQY